MKKIILVLIFIFPFAFKSIADSPYVKGQVILMLKNNEDTNYVANWAKENIGNNSKLLPLKNLSFRMNLWLFSFDESSINSSNLINSLKACEYVKLVQANHIVSPRATIPNDTLFANMWSMNNTGQLNGLIDADIDAPEAWDISTGGITATGDTIVMAVIDAGFDLNQTDINFWKNRNEIPGNSIDDDNNGYIDDYDGWNSYFSTGAITNDSHGTHVCGTVGAKGNNNIGVVGVNWGAQIMPIQGSGGASQEAAVLESYGYVLNARTLYNQTNGAQGTFVVSTNSSFGIDAGQPSNFPIWCAFYDSLGQQGILNAGATANQNYNIDLTSDIPTACVSEFLISVTNTTRTDTRNSNSGFGLTTIDLGAPGTGIPSTLPNNTYGNQTGTSMASPHVCGAVGLMLASAQTDFIEAYKNNPSEKALLLKTLMLLNVDTIAALTGNTVSSGRLNLYKSCNAVFHFNDTISTSSIENIPNPFGDFLLSPNPANALVELSYFLKKNDFVEVELINIAGEIIYSQALNYSKQGYNKHKLNLPELNGFYFVRIKQNNTYSSIQKLIISNK